MIKRSFSTAIFLGLYFTPQGAYATCATPAPPPTQYTEADVYQGLPFSKGEFLKFDVSYLGIHAGFLEFKVLQPTTFNNRWFMGFNTLVITGEWYNKIFKAKDEGTGYASPSSFQPYEFRLTQDNNPLFGRRYIEDKLLRFDTQNCTVTEEYRDDKGKVTKSVQAALEPDAMDILSALYNLRTVDFVKNAEAKIKVYTSEKNWWLTATREDFVHLNVPAGKFDAVRLKLQTFIGKELQQKGAAKIWIAINHPNKPLLKIEAQIKIGSFIAVLSKFDAGTPPAPLPPKK